MTMSQTHFLSEILRGEVIPSWKRAYFQERLRNRLYSLILSEFVYKRESENLSQRTLAHRIGKGPDQINRWLSSPGNWTLDTVSDLLLGICGAELNPSINIIADQPVHCNTYGPEWLSKGHTIDITTNNVVQLRSKPIGMTVPSKHPFPVATGTL
jgi:hypothetical protein